MEVKNIMNFREESFAEGEAKARAELTPLLEEKDEQLATIKTQNIKNVKKIEKLEAWISEQGLNPSF